jgi:hypothetical protein
MGTEFEFVMRKRKYKKPFQNQVSSALSTIMAQAR